MTTLNLKQIVDVSVEVSPTAAPRAAFNQLLIIGVKGLTIGKPIQKSERLRKYSSVSDMLMDGFVVDDPEYIAAAKYMAQSPVPESFWIGVRDNTSSPEETVLEALTDCRIKQADWYIVYSTDVTKEEIPEIALYVESAVPSTIFAYNTLEMGVLIENPTPADVCTELKDLSYSRSIGMYTTSAHAICGIMGYACGANSGLANSAFTLFGKMIVGATTENLTYNQKSIVEAKNCNLYLNYANYYNVFEPGVMANGFFFDQIINRDMLVNDIQLSCMDLLYQNRKIPQTEAGMGMIYNALVTACELAVTRGHLAPGTYTGVPFLNLNTGDALPNGYIIQTTPLADQSPADRALRKAVPFYVTIKEAGAVHSITIEVIVNI